MEDLSNELQGKVPYALGIRNIMDKDEMKAKIQQFLDSKK
jgi:PTS system ascorbate-specific IIB component